MEKFFGRRYCSALFVLILLMLQTGNSFAQDSWWKNKKYKSESKRVKFNNCKKTFVIVGDGISYSNSYVIKGYMSSEIYINISDNENGYFSSDQSQLILENFFTNNIVSSFKWKSSSAADIYAFATGKYKYKRNGFINYYTLSISLKYINNVWLIDQIIIN